MIFGQLLLTFGDFFWSHCSYLRYDHRSLSRMSQQGSSRIYNLILRSKRRWYLRALRMPQDDSSRLIFSSSYNRLSLPKYKQDWRRLSATKKLFICQITLHGLRKKIIRYARVLKTKLVFVFILTTIIWGVNVISKLGFRGHPTPRRRRFKQYLQY